MFLFSLIAFFAVLLASFVLNFVHYMHMFQLNSYSAEEHFHWIKKNIGNIVLRHVFPFAAAAYALIIVLTSGTVTAGDILICAGIICIGMIFCKRKPAKKKLVFTPRVIRMCVTSTLIYGAVCALSMIFLYMQGFFLPVLCLWQVFSAFMPMIANFINKPL